MAQVLPWGWEVESSEYCRELLPIHEFPPASRQPRECVCGGVSFVMFSFLLFSSANPTYFFVVFGIHLLILDFWIYKCKQKSYALCLRVVLLRLLKEHAQLQFGYPDEYFRQQMLFWQVNDKLKYGNKLSNVQLEKKVETFFGYLIKIVVRRRRRRKDVRCIYFGLWKASSKVLFKIYLIQNMLLLRRLIGKEWGIHIITFLLSSYIATWAQWD